MSNEPDLLTKIRECDSQAIFPCLCVFAWQPGEVIWRRCALHQSAPDLLEACEGLMWRFDVEDADPHAPPMQAPDIQAARAAIARAKGE